MSPSPEARELLRERRHLFTERRRSRRFWGRWAPWIAIALVLAWHEMPRLFL